jgi:hypothetical protein
MSSGEGAGNREGKPMEARKVRVVGPELADCPEDGGKWALYCDHLVDGEWVNAGLIQDTNKRRLAEHKSAKFCDGLTEWCPECQAMTTDPTAWRNREREWF